MKTNRILAVIAAVVSLSLASCERKSLEGPSVAEGEGAPVTVDLSFSLPEGTPRTKAMGGSEAITNVYVAVFSANHYLNQFAMALPLTQSLDDSGTTFSHVSLDSDGQTPLYQADGSGKYHIRVTLAQSGSSSSPRYVHVLANVDTSNLPDFDSYENEVMGENLYTEGTQEGYWAYVEMDNGINQTELDTKFKNLTLVRNYATVNLEAKAGSGLTILDFDVFNVPSKGTFAAYTGSGTTYFTGFSSSVRYSETVAQYEGYHPDSWTLKTVPATLSSGSGPKYVFEQPADKVHSKLSTDNTSAFIVAKVKKDSDGSEKYYRIDMVDSYDNRVSILRNMDYTVTLTSIGVSGYDTATDAAQHPSDFNVTMDPITQPATEITNGDAIMRVEYVEKVFTAAVSGATFKYQYLSKASDPSTSAKARVFAIEGSSKVSTSDANWSSGGTALTGDDAGWYQLAFDVDDPPVTGQETATFKIIGGSGSNMIQRIVTIVVMGKNSFTEKDKSYNSANRELTFKLHIPAGLPSSIFPLQLLFEDSNQAMSPQVDGLTSTSGNGLNGGTDKIQFQRNFRWASYNATTGTDMQLTFKAPSSAPASGKIYVKDRDGMFNLLEVEYN